MSPLHIPNHYQEYHCISILANVLIWYQNVTERKSPPPGSQKIEHHHLHINIISYTNSIQTSSSLSSPLMPWYPSQRRITWDFWGRNIKGVDILHGGFNQKVVCLVVSTHLKNISQNGNLPQIGVKMKNIWNHHLENDHPHRCFLISSIHFTPTPVCLLPRNEGSWKVRWASWKVPQKKCRRISMTTTALMSYHIAINFSATVLQCNTLTEIFLRHSHFWTCLKVSSCPQFLSRPTNVIHGGNKSAV